MLAVDVLLAGVVIGALYGMFGAGCSAFATPMLVLLGLAPVAAVATPLPAVLPASLAGAHRYVRAGKLDRRVARLAIVGGAPGTLVGALASSLVGDRLLLVASGTMLLVVGVRMLLPDPAGGSGVRAGRRDRDVVVLAVAFAVGVSTGLLANGGGFLLVPAFVLVLGLDSREAAGTSMVAVGALTVPTLVVHAALGHIDWPLALVFAVGVLPGSIAGAHLAQRIPPRPARRAFALALIACAVWFVARSA